MKKLFLALFLLAGSLSFADAQIKVASDETYGEDDTWIYCELVGIQRGFSNKVTVEIDYGQESKLFSRDQRIMDRRTGKPKVFNSMIDAMNSMGELGWEFVQAYVVISGGSSEIHYILNRKVTDEEKRKIVPVIKKDLRN